MNPDTRMNITGARLVAEMIHLIACTPRQSGRVYHVLRPTYIKVIDALKAFRDITGIPLPRCIPAERFPFEKLTPIQRKMVDVYVPYWNQKPTVFDVTNTRRLLKPYDHPALRPECNTPDAELDRFRTAIDGYLRMRREVAT